MNLFRPTMYRKDIFEIDYQKLKEKGITCLIFDLDNTLGMIDQKKCPAKVKKLLRRLQKDFLILINSNNTRSRLRTYMMKNQEGKDVSIYDEKTHTGVLRHLVTKIGFTTGEVMVVLVANGKKLPYLNELGVGGYSFALKPSTRNLAKIKKIYNLKKKEMVMIGDQIVTDILSGNKFKIMTILVDPLGEKDLKITGLNRQVEAKIVRYYQKRGVFERGKYYE